MADPTIHRMQSSPRRHLSRIRPYPPPICKTVGSEPVGEASAPVGGFTMRRPLLALLALVPATALVATSSPAAPTKYPAGAVVYRPECFGGVAADQPNYNQGYP